MIDTTFYYRVAHRKSTLNRNYVLGRLEFITSFQADSLESYRVLVGPKSIVNPQQATVLQNYRAPFWLPLNLQVTPQDFNNRMITWVDNLFHSVNRLGEPLQLETIVNSYLTCATLSPSIVLRTHPAPSVVPMSNSCVVDKFIGRHIPENARALTVDVGPNWTAIINDNPTNCVFLPLNVENRTEISNAYLRVLKSQVLTFASPEAVFVDAFIRPNKYSIQKTIPATLGYYLQMMYPDNSAEYQAIQTQLDTVGMMLTCIQDGSASSLTSISAGRLDDKFAAILALLQTPVAKTLTSKQVLLIKERLSHALSHLRK